MKVAVIYPSPSKEDKEIILRAFEAYKIPVSFYPTPSFNWKEIVKKEKMIVVCCSGNEHEKAKEYLTSLPHKPNYYILPLAKYFTAKAANITTRKEIAAQLAIIKLDIDDLENKTLQQAKEIVLNENELADLTYSTIMSLRNSDQLPLRVRTRTTEGQDKIIKITQKKEDGAFTFEELLGIRLLLDLTDTKEASIVQDNEEEK